MGKILSGYSPWSKIKNNAYNFLNLLLKKNCVTTGTSINQTKFLGDRILMVSLSLDDSLILLKKTIYRDLSEVENK